MIEKELTGKGVYLGRQGTANEVAVWYDISEWMENTAGSGVLMFWAPDGSVWPMQTSINTEEGRMYGMVTLTETAQYGNAAIEARWHAGAVVYESEYFNAYVMPSELKGEIDSDKTPTWVQELILGYNIAANITDEARAAAHEANEALSGVEEASEAADRAEQAAAQASTGIESAAENAEESEAWAKGTREGVDVEPGDEAYENNSKFFAQQSEAYAVGTRGGNPITDELDPAYGHSSMKYASDSEAYAVGKRGGSTIEDPDDPAYHNNAKYWSDNAFSGTPEGYSALVTLVDQMDEMVNGIPITMTAGGYIALNVTPTDPDNVQTLSGISYGKMQCSGGDIFVINARGASSGRAYGFIDEDGNVLEAAAASATLTAETVTAPAGSAMIIVNNLDDTVSYKRGTIDSMSDYLRKRMMLRFIVPVANAASVSYVSTTHTITVNGLFGPTNVAGGYKNISNLSVSWGSESYPNRLRFIFYKEKSNELVALSAYSSDTVKAKIAAEPENYLLICGLVPANGIYIYTSSSLPSHWYYDGQDIYARDDTYSVLTGSSDLNSITSTGNYCCFTTPMPANWPVSYDKTSAVFGYLKVMGEDSIQITQTVTDFYNNVYVRMHRTTGWTDWVQYTKRAEITALASQVTANSTKLATVTPTKAYAAKVFRRVGCIGDSYTEGWISNSDATGIYPGYSWPAYMKRITGQEWTNFGKSGSSCKSWMDGGSYSRLSEVQASGNKCQAYVIGLMINDSNSEAHAYVPVGSAADIGLTVNSYYSYYYRLIKAINTVNPTAPIFCNTCPQSADRFTDYNTAVRTIVTYCRNENMPVYLCDLAGDDYNTTDYYANAVYTADYVNGHYTGIGYEMMAECYLRVMSDVMLENIGEFQSVHLIPYDEPTE